MAHVVFRVGDAAQNGKRAQLIVDGHDITDSVLSEGFRIAPSGTDSDGEWAVSMTLAVDALEADLPESVVAAVRAGREAS